MIFLIALVEALIFVYFFRGAIRKQPGIFYVLSLGIIALMVCYQTFDLYSAWPEWTYIWIVSVFWRGAFPTALFVIVMYLGALNKKSKVVKALMPIRGYLSIIACLMTLAHSFVYGTYYVPAVLHTPQELGTRDIIALIITVPMFVIMIILMVTSFTKVRRRMKPLVWKKIQRLAYPWFALLYLYLMVLLIPNMIDAVNPAYEMDLFYRINYVLSILLYTAVFGGYLILKIRKIRTEKL
ncbi:ferric reductase-like transmembrane domain-containing protein [Lacrimispora sp. JR3]|uniref:ferric reductase-like transmembrane domain-containing protein n=1 Tax=Lacrimispora sinapis TaxID=3111456 RepID=UPI00374A5F91